MPEAFCLSLWIFRLQEGGHHNVAAVENDS